MNAIVPRKCENWGQELVPSAVRNILATVAGVGPLHCVQLQPHCPGTKREWTNIFLSEGETTEEMRRYRSPDKGLARRTSGYTQRDNYEARTLKSNTSDTPAQPNVQLRVLLPSKKYLGRRRSAAASGENQQSWATQSDIWCVIVN